MTEQADTPSGEEIPSLFSQFVLTLSATALQQLGKLVNPFTNKTEVSLRDAQSTISILEMLEDKTKGNLDDTEKKILSDSLTAVRLNYVETVNQQGQTDAPASASSEAPSQEKADTPDAGKDEKQPKFRKKYD